MKRMISLLLAAAAVLGLLSGCGGNTPNTASGASETTASVQSSAAPANTAASTEAPTADPASVMESMESAEEADIPQISYPLTDENVTLTYWQAWPPFLSSYCSLADCKTFAKLEEITGIHLDFVEVDSESAGEKFNLMVTASACTDLVQGGVQRYTGGGTQAIMDEVFYDLEPYVAQYMPNYNAAIGGDESIRKALVDDEGQMAQICGIYNDYYYQDQGMWIRQDFLDQLKLDMPNTMDELEHVLEAFKTQLELPEPLVLLSAGTLTFLQKTYETGMLVEDGQIIDNSINDHMKDYYKKLHEWWEKGYVKKDFLSNSYSFIKPPEDTVYQNKCGMFNEDVASIETYVKNSETPGFELRAMPQTLLTKDQKLHNGPIGSKLNEKYSLSISTNCSPDNAVLACEMLDYMFSPEGSILGNYGVEGYSFEYGADGKPQFTDFILNHELGYQGAQTAFINPRIPCLVDMGVAQLAYSDAQKEAVDVWRKNFTDSTQTPPVYSMTADELSEAASLQVNINTYVSEMTLKFIMGEADIDESWDDYVNTIQSMGYDTVLELNNQAYARYLEK